MRQAIRLIILSGSYLLCETGDGESRNNLVAVFTSFNNLWVHYSKSITNGKLLTVNNFSPPFSHTLLAHSAVILLCARVFLLAYFGYFTHVFTDFFFVHLISLQL